MTYKKSWVMKQDAGDGKMKEISDHIYEGALAFLNAEYRLLSIFVLVVSLALSSCFCYSANYTHFNCCCFYFWSICSQLGLEIWE